MQNMKKKVCDGNNNSDKGGGGGGGGDDLKQKERHLVSWSKEEDDILRKEIGIHGTDNWAIIASKFENKTTRQCRRRWFTYLNSDFKKGGWTSEEDILLCEAQKIFGNRWTEIAKVVSGRTDNAVKNRFSILCKRKAKHEASSKENNDVNINANNKRTVLDNRQDTEGILETSMHPMKLRRKHIAATTEDCNIQQRRHPFVVLVQNCNNTNTSIDASSGNMVEAMFFKKDDPKIVALMQQAELPNSRALQVNTDEKTKMAEDLCEVEEPQPSKLINPSNLVDDRNIEDIIPSSNKLNDDVRGVYPLPNSEFNSPLQVTPLFRSMAEGIPSPQFSESEKHFLLKTLGMEATPPNPTTRTSQSPSCKRALLHCL